MTGLGLWVCLFSYFTFLPLIWNGILKSLQFCLSKLYVLLPTNNGSITRKISKISV